MKSNKYWILLASILVVLLGSSIALNFLLFHRGKQYYLELNHTRLDPLGWKKYPPKSNPKTKDSRVRLVFFGDSRSASWPSPDADGFEFINRGIGSQTSIQTLQRFEQHVTPLKPDVLLLQVGVNDLKTIPLFPGKKESIIAETKTNINQIVENAKASGAAVILTPIFPVGEIPLERRPFWSDEVSLAIKEVNGYINSLAGNNVMVFDAFSILADENGVLRREYKQDELHLNSEGYEALNRELVKVLNSL